MARDRLLRSKVEKLAMGEKAYDVADTEQPGFAVRVHPSGVKTYILRYRPRGAGRKLNPRIITLGRHPHVTPEQARDLAREKLALIAQGRDPALRDRNKVPVKEVLDGYLDRMKARASHRTIKYDVENHLRPALGHLLVSELTPEKVEALAARLKGQGKVTTAGRVVRTLRAALGKARVDATAAREVEAPGWRKRKRVATKEELARFFAACDEALETDAVWPWAIYLFQLLIFTGARPSEIRTARRTDVDLDNRRIVREEHKTAASTGEPRIIELSVAATEIIRDMPTKGDNPYLIPGRRKDEPLKVYAKPWAWICERAGLEGVWVYDLRRGLPSLGVGMGFTLSQLGDVLGHKNDSTTAGYTWLLPNERRKVVETIGEQLRELGGAASPTTRKAPRART